MGEENKEKVKKKKNQNKINKIGRKLNNRIKSIQIKYLGHQNKLI